MGWINLVRPTVSPTRVVITIALALGVATWIAWVVGIGASGWVTDSNGGVLGADYAMFHTAAQMIREGAGALIYDSAEFQRQMGLVTGTDPGATAAYLLMPFFALLLIPLSYLPYLAGWFVWSLAAIAALAVSFRLLGRNATAWTLSVIVAFPVFMMLRLGQASFIATLLFAAVIMVLKTDRPIVAGLIASLLLYKPQLVLGLVVWWLIDRRYWRALIGFVVGAAVLLVTSWIVAPDWLLPYFDAVSEARERFDSPGFMIWAYTPLRFFDLLLQNYTAVLVFTLASTLAGLVAFATFWRHHRSNPLLLGAAAVILSVWVTPHLLVYDWTVLVVPAAIFWGERAELRPRWLVLGSLLVIASAVSGAFTVVQLTAWSRSVQIAVPTLAVVVAVMHKAMRQPGPLESIGTKPT